MISKELFVEAINEIEKCYRAVDKLDNVFRSYDPDNQIFSLPSCDDVLIDVLVASFGASERISSYIREDIEYYCYEIDFGKDYKEGCVTDSVGKPIDISTPEAVYDFILTYVDGGESNGE